MNAQPGRDEAASALADIGLQQEKAIAAALVPGWYWAVIAACMVAIGIAVDNRTRLVLATVIPVAVLVIVIATLAMIFGVYRRVRIRDRDLLGGRGALAIVGFVFAVDGISLGLAFALRAAGASHPATIGTGAGAVALLAGGPALMSMLRRIMLANRAGAR